MMSKSLLAAGAICATMAVAGAAHAATVDFTGGTGDGSFISFTVGTPIVGTNLTITGTDAGSPLDAGGNPVRVSRLTTADGGTRQGLGVATINPNSGGSATAIDEVLELEFSNPVQVTSIVLARQNDGVTQDFSFEVAGGGAGSVSGSIDTTASNTGETFATSLTGTVFELSSSSLSGPERGVFLYSITIAEPVSAVPLPGTAPILAGGLIAGAAMLRRRRKAAK